jgi:glutathione-specific gamma-glutamylcyclotransferase
MARRTKGAKSQNLLSLLWAEASGTSGDGAGGVVRLAMSDEHWVFGYGSLMWRPGFEFLERHPATLHGRHRAFCIYSVHHRGTYERPGLVLGLAPGGSARGVAYRVAARDWPDVYAYLREREQPTETYVEAQVTIRLQGGDALLCLTFLSDVSHPQWAGVLSLEKQAQMIEGATGLSGKNVDYLRDLVSHLAEEDISDRNMHALLGMVEARARPA